VPIVLLAYIDTSIYFAVLCNYALISLSFIVHRKLAVECDVYFYITVSFYSVSHSLNFSHFHYIVSVFQKPWLYVIRVDHCTGQNTFSKAASISRQKRSIVSIRVLVTNVHESSLQLWVFASRVILVTTDCLCPTVRRERLARQRSSSCTHPAIAAIAATWNTPPEKRPNRTAPSVRVPFARGFPCLFHCL